MMGQTEQSEHIATGLKFIEAEVISLSNSQFYIILHHIMQCDWVQMKPDFAPKVLFLKFSQLYCSHMFSTV